jgi:hypothetical protein
MPSPVVGPGGNCEPRLRGSRIAEFLEKLRYLYAQQAKIWDLPDNGDDYGCIVVVAAACHFCPVNAGGCAFVIA